MPKQQQEVVRLRELLKNLIKLAGVSNREVERKLKLSPGYLSRLFSGAIELKVLHLVRIAEAIGLEPADLFHLAYPKPPRFASSQARKVREIFTGFAPSPAEAEPLQAHELGRPTQDEVEAMLLAALRKLLTEGGRRPG